MARKPKAVKSQELKPVIQEAQESFVSEKAWSADRISGAVSHEQKGGKAASQARDRLLSDDLPTPERFNVDEVEEEYCDTIPLGLRPVVYLFLTGVYVFWFGPVALNWPPIREMLAKDGVYSWKCGEGDELDEQGTCSAQRKIFASIGNLSQTFMFVGAFFAGLTLALAGPKKCSVTGLSMFCLSFVLLCVSSEKVPLYYFGYILNTFGIEFAFFGVLSVPNLFPHNRALVLTLLGCGRSLSALQSILQNALMSKDHRVFNSIRHVYLLWLGLCVLFAVLAYFIIPRRPFDCIDQKRNASFAAHGIEMNAMEIHRASSLLKSPSRADSWQSDLRQTESHNLDRDVNDNPRHKSNLIHSLSRGSSRASHNRSHLAADHSRDQMDGNLTMDGSFTLLVNDNGSVSTRPSSPADKASSVRTMTQPGDGAPGAHAYHQGPSDLGDVRLEALAAEIDKDFSTTSIFELSRWTRIKQSRFLRAILIIPTFAWLVCFSSFFARLQWYGLTVDDQASAVTRAFTIMMPLTFIPGPLLGFLGDKFGMLYIILLLNTAGLVQQLCLIFGNGNTAALWIGLLSCGLVNAHISSSNYCWIQEAYDPLVQGRIAGLCMCVAGLVSLADTPLYAWASDSGSFTGGNWIFLGAACVGYFCILLMAIFRGHCKA